MTAFLLYIWKNPLVRKALVYVVVSLAVLYAFKVWLNKHDDRVYRQGKIAASAEIQRQKEAEWKAREAELETRARGLEEARARIETDRLNLYRSLDNALDTLSAAKDRDFTAAAAVPADRLDDALRAVSRELAPK